MRNRKRRLGCIVPLALFLLLIAYLGWEYYVSNNVLRVERTTLRFDRLPKAFDGLTLVHLSDMHEKRFGKDGRALYDRVREQKPDLIAITGDIIHSVEGLPFLREACAELSAIAPVYYVTGNHEWAVEWKEDRAGNPSFIARLKEILLETGVHYLDSQTELLPREGGSVALVGICDPNGPDYAPDAADMGVRLRDSYGEIAADGAALFSIALCHRFDLFESYVSAGFDLTLTGHAHGGVIRPPFTEGLIGPDREWFPKRTGGVYSSGRSRMAVSRGIGDTYVPRLWNRPQVSVLTLEAGGG